MPSSSAAAEGVRLGSAHVETERHEREVLNLKLEIAHLRERLLLRVGGDTTAAELEAETFGLKQTLIEAQESLASHQKALQELDAKHAKALQNLVKLDQAWRASADDVRRLRGERRIQEAAHATTRRELEEQRARHEDEMGKLQKAIGYHKERLAAAEAESADKESRLAGRNEEIERLTLKLREVEEELAITRAQQKATIDHVNKADYEKLEQSHRETLETTAALRGEVHALRGDRTRLREQLSEARAGLSAAMAKFLQLKEDHAGLEVQAASANENGRKYEQDAKFYEEEVGRLQSQIVERDEQLLLLQRTIRELEQQLDHHKRRLEEATVVREHEAKRIEHEHELSWKDRQFELESAVRSLQQRIDDNEDQLASSRVTLGELGRLTGTDGEGGRNDIVNAVRQLLDREHAAITQQSVLQKRIEQLEGEVTETKELAQENAALRVELDRTRAAMERIVHRKSRVGGASGTTSQVRGPSTSMPGAADVSVVESGRSSRRSPVRGRVGASTNRLPDGSAVGTKRKLELRAAVASKGDGPLTPSKTRLVYVPSRYLQKPAPPRR